MPHSPLLRLAVATLAASLATSACNARPSDAAVQPNAANAQPNPAPPAANGMPSDSLALRAAADSGRIEGDPGAKVWLIMASDFQCPYCKQWHDQSYAALQREYVASGRARAAFMNFPLDQHAQAMPAAEAAMCASAQRKFWQYQSALFATQARWSTLENGAPVYDSLATALALDLPAFRRCTGSHVMQALVEADRERMERAGVRSTPSFFVGNQQIAGAQPISVFRTALDALLR